MKTRPSRRVHFAEQVAAWALVPVKSFEVAKSRLATLLAPAERAAFQRAMLTDVLTSLNRVSRLAGVAVMTRDEEVAAFASEFGVVVLPEPLASIDLNSSLHFGVATLRDLGANQALIVPADVPFIDPVEVEAIISLGREGAPIVIPNRDFTGTNALLVRVDPPFLLSFGPDSYGRHLACTTQGQPASVFSQSLSLDVDTPADVADLQVKLGAPMPSIDTTARTAKWLSGWQRRFIHQVHWHSTS